MQNREEIAALLTQAATSLGTTPLLPSTEPYGKRQAMLRRRREFARQELETLAKRENRSKALAEREQWIRERAGVVGVDSELLLPPRDPTGSTPLLESGLSHMDAETIGSDEYGDEHDQDKNMVGCDVAFLLTSDRLNPSSTLC